MTVIERVVETIAMTVVTREVAEIITIEGREAVDAMKVQEIEETEMIDEQGLLLLRDVDINFFYLLFLI